MSNSLSAVHPELVAEWSEKNLPLTPDNVTFGSNKKVWWKGVCGHEWETSVKARSNGEKCPICSGARVIEGINDLSTLKPKLALEWSEKNEIKSTEVTIGSHKKVIWKCKLGHEWTATVKSRTINGTGCPYCSHNIVLAGFNDLATVLPKVAAEWSDRNEKKPTEVTAFANSKAWWKCKTCGYEWNTLISTRSYGSKCPCCNGYVLVEGKNDLKTTHPNIAEEWSEKNFPLQPDEVNAKSRKNVWWHCKKCGNEWKSVINARVKGTVCPVCAERAVLAGYNDLATTDRELLAEWDYELNKLKPTEISRNSSKRAWWKCRYGHSWSMKIIERAVAEQFGESRRSVKAAFDRLEEIGVIRREFRNIETNSGMVLNNVMYIDLCVDRLYTCTYLDIPGDDEDVENTGEEIQKQAENQANKPVTKFCTSSYKTLYDPPTKFCNTPYKTSYDPPAKFCNTLPQNDVPPHTKFCKTNTENTTENTEEITYPIIPSGTGVKTDTMDRMDEVRSFIKDNIDYDVLLQCHPTEKMDINELVELMVETIAVKQPVIRINKYDFPYDVVRSRLEKIDFHTMEYVLECLRNNTTKVRNIRSYMLTTLYNAPVTCSNYYKAEVNHDFYGK